MKPAYALPEDDPLVATVLMLDRELARGGPGAIPSPQANFNALAPMPGRILSAGDRATELGCEPLAGDGLHDLVRLARSFEQLVKSHSFGGSLQLAYDDPRSNMTLKAVIPTLLLIESSLAVIDGGNPGTDGLVEVRRSAGLILPLIPSASA
jgi:hypothetical protein